MCIDEEPWEKIHRPKLKVLVTGAAGFIGSYLVPELRRAGHEVVPADREAGALELSGVADHLLSMHRPEVVIHLAAAVSRVLCEDDPARTVSSNALATARVARACTHHGARLVYCSTSEVYGDQGETMCHEVSGPWGLPHNLYGLTKRWGEEVARLYAPKGLQIILPSMTYGPGLLAGRGRAAIINMLWQAHHRAEIPVHVGAARSWCWIGDIVRGMRMVIDRGVEGWPGGCYNVGRDDAEVPMTVVAAMACEIAGAPRTLIRLVEPPKNQTVVKRLSTSKLRGLGWAPTVDLREGMERTYEWVRELDAEGKPCLASRS